LNGFAVNVLVRVGNSGFTKEEAKELGHVIREPSYS